jgi:hypothetical protein
MPTPDRSFLVGETVHLRSRVSLPGTRTPTDPASVTLTSLRRDGVETLVEPTPFTRVREGEYVLTLTTGLLPSGTYDVVVTHADGPAKVSLATDRFVLRSL